MKNKPTDSWPREALTGVPREPAVKLLTSPKLKLTGKNRRGLKKALCKRILPPSGLPKSDTDRTLQRLLIRPLESLLRRQKRLQSIIRNGKRLADELPADSMARRLVSSDLQRWESMLQLLNDLVKHRVSGPAKRDATPHKKRKK